MRINIMRNLAVAISSAACLCITGGILVQDKKMQNAKMEIKEKDSLRYNRLINVPSYSFKRDYDMWTKELKNMRDSLAVANYNNLK